MKYAFLLLFITVILYIGYQGSDPKTRKTAIKSVTYHGIRLGGLILVLVLLMAAAYYLPVSSFTL